ncbi:hypothetical protein DFR29_103323 [Tahibacter aquaticus]|uniref:Lipocalin-like protein n=1 Tax=Tahibacter aquaticus TaxID=520092 RepID=A0A4R6Z512_9GAMM|nr:hypothetical protein [Tahibacter aquaticus]TDR46787.1 hypothetical protein DFR29_103323 [Tahibacter aquaticus]
MHSEIAALMRRFSDEKTMSILGEWKISSSVAVDDGVVEPTPDGVVEQVDDLVRIEERNPPVNPRRARYTCIRGGMVEFSGDLDLNAAGDEVSGTFTDGARYTIRAELKIAGGDETISGLTTRKGASESSTGQWDGKRP